MATRFPASPHLALLPLLIVLVACGSSPTRPTPQPPATFAGTVTDTVTLAPVFGFSATISNGRLTVAAPGYVTRETSASASTVDLIPEAGFDLAFYRQFARGALEGPVRPLLVLSAAPSVYAQTSSRFDMAAMEQAARDTLPALTGGRFTVAAFESGPTPRPAQAGWIMVAAVTEPSGCGRATTGAVAGNIWLNVGNANCTRPWAWVFAHELGHALGFWHVDSPNALMRPEAVTTGTPSALERHHAAIAYRRMAGNRDVDVD